MPRVLPLLGTQVLVGIVVMLGFLLFIVPGIIFSLWFYVVIPVVVLEGLAGSRAMGRSRELVRGNLDKAFLLGLAVFLLGAIFGWALSSVAQLVPRLTRLWRRFLSASCRPFGCPSRRRRASCSTTTCVSARRHSISRSCRRR